MRAYKALLKTEIKLSIRDMNMIIFAIFIPVIVTIIIGMLYETRLAFDGANYSFLEQSFGAISTISICAGGLMGLPIVLTDYRERKILKKFKVTPTSPVILLLVELTIYMIYSFISLLLIYLTSKIFWDFNIIGSMIKFLLIYILVMLSMFSIGLMIGGTVKNSKIAGVVASLLYFPMLIFSGATLPYEVMPKMVQDISNFFPLTQGIKLLKSTVLDLPTNNNLFPIIVMISIFIICFSISIKFFKWE